MEGNIPEARILGEVKCKYGSFGSHLKNLNDVKDALCDQCNVLGANAVLQFTYGQKTRWLAIDDMIFFGNGLAAIVDPARIEPLVSK